MNSAMVNRTCAGGALVRGAEHGGQQQAVTVFLAAHDEQVGPGVVLERRGGGGLDLDGLAQPRLHRPARSGRPGRPGRLGGVPGGEGGRRVRVEAGRRRVLSPAAERPDVPDQRQPLPGGEHGDPHDRVGALAAAVVVDRVPGPDQPGGRVVALTEDGLGHARLGAAQRDPQGHLLVDGPQVGRERAARRLGGEQQVQAERRAPLGDIGEQPPGLPGQPVLLAEQHLELVHDHQGPRQHLPGLPPVIRQVRDASLAAQPGPPLDLLVEPPQHREPELAVGPGGDRARVRQPFGQVGVELDLLEVEQVELELLRRIAAARAG